MRRSLFALSICAAAALVIAGCSKNSGSPTSPATDPNVAAVQYFAVHADSMNDFNESDSVTLDDQGAQNPEYDNSGTAKVSSQISPIRYGRKMLWAEATRSYATVMVGDTAAVVTVTRSVPGIFYVVAQDTLTLADTTYTKSFTEAIKRSFYFKRIARRTNADSNWVSVAVSIGYGYSKPDSTLGFKIADVEFSSSYDTVASVPLSTWFLLGHPLRSGVPFVQVGDSVRVRVWVESADSSAEVVFLRHGVAPFAAGSMRVQMNLVADSAVTGGYVRVYARTFAVHNFAPLHPLDFIRRYSAFVDVIASASIRDSSAPVQNEYWAFPYIAYK